MINIISLDVAVRIVIIIILIAISIIDFRKTYIPNPLTLSLIIIGIFYNGFFKNNLERAILGMGMYSILFSLIYGYFSDLLGKEVLGYGDVKLSMGVGAYLGYTNLENIYNFFMYSFLVGAMYAVFLLIKFKKRDIQIPFGPFISISACMMIFITS